MLSSNMRRKMYEYVEEEIGLRIIKGEFKPGETLPNEEAICKEFGVSRGVLREATKMLSKKGLIQSRPRIGTQIQPRSHWNLFDEDVLTWELKAGHQLEFLIKVTEVRRIIESEAAKLAARRATASEIHNTQILYHQMEDDLGNESEYDYEKYLLLDMSFHTAILEASHNDILAQIGHTMRHAVQTVRLTDIQDIKVQRESLPFHAAIMRGISERDSESAYKASTEMFDQVWRHLPSGHQENAID